MKHAYFASLLKRYLHDDCTQGEAWTSGTKPATCPGRAGRHQSACMVANTGPDPAGASRVAHVAVSLGGGRWAWAGTEPPPLSLFLHL